VYTYITSVRSLRVASVDGRHSTNPWVVLVLVCLAQFMVVLDATVVNVAPFVALLRRRHVARIEAEAATATSF